MKKLLLSTVVCVAMAAQAQDLTVVKQGEEMIFSMIPAPMTTANKAMFVMASDTEKEPRKDIVYQIFDSSFGDVKTITISLVKGYYKIKDGVKEEDKSGKALITRTTYYDVEAGNNDNDQYITFSQTLFNCDEKLEYIRPDYTLKKEEAWNGSEYYRPVVEGYSIVQDDGTVLASIPASNGRTFYYAPDVVKSYDAVYLIVDEVDEDRNFTTIIYKWNDNGNSIHKVKEMSGMRAFPNPARRSETVTVDVPENVQNGSLIVTNSAGVTLQTVKLNGQRQAAVSTARMSSGVYNVTLVSDGKRLQTSRIIVK